MIYQVNKDICNILTSSQRVQYLIELFASGHKQGSGISPHEDMSSAECLRLLQKHEARQTATHFDRIVFQLAPLQPNLRPSYMFLLVNGVLGHFFYSQDGGSLIKLKALPSFLTASSTQWKTEINISFHFTQWCFHPMLDLIVVSPTPQHLSDCEIFLISMTGGQPHPLAQKPILCNGPDVGRLNGLKLCGSALGGSFEVSDGEGRSRWAWYVWNWMIGEIIAVRRDRLYKHVVEA